MILCELINVIHEGAISDVVSDAELYALAM